MSKIFDIDFRKGTLIDSASGRAGTLTIGNGGFKQTEKGMALHCDGSATKMYFKKDINLNNDWSISIVGKTTDLSNPSWDGYITLSDLTYNYSLGCSITPSRFLLYDYVGMTNVGFSYTNAISDTIFHNIIITFNGTTKLCTVYLDNQENGSSTISGTLRTSPYIEIGYQSTGTGYFTGPILNAQIYDHVLTASERLKLYQQFLSSKPTFKPKENIKGKVKPDNLNENGLVAAYNMILDGNTLVDISGNGNNFVLNAGELQTLNGIRIQTINNLSNSDGKFNMGMSNFTICMRINCRTFDNTSRLLFGMYQGSSVPYWVLDQLNNGVLYIPMRDSNSQTANIRTLNDFPINQDFDIVAIINRTTNIGKIYINGVDDTDPAYTDISALTGNLSNNSANKFIRGVDTAINEYYDIKLYNRALSENEVKEYHNSFASQLYLKEDFSNSPADGSTNILPEGWTAGTGTFKLDEFVIQTGDLLVGWDFTNWSNFQSTDTSDTITLTDISGGIYKSYLTVGKKYRIIVNGNVNQLTSGFFYISTGFSVRQDLYSKNTTGNFSIDLEFTALYTQLYIRMTSAAIGDNFTINNISVIEIPPLPNFITNQKYLECVGAGANTLAIPSKQAYGTWEFDWYHGGSDVTGYSRLLFISETNKNYPNANGYGIDWGIGGSLRFFRLNDTPAFTSKFITNTSYISVNTWYRIKVTRTYDGTFTFYIKGGDFGDEYILVDVTGGTGTNPITDNTHTTSNFFALVSYVTLDKITNIKLTQGIKV